MAHASLAARFPVLASLSAETPVSLASTFIRRSASSGEVIFSEGDAPEAVFFLDEGLVKVVKHSSRPAPSALEFIVPGGLFGMIAVLDRKPYPVTAVAARDCVYYRVSAANFEALTQRYPAFGREVFRQIGDHVRNGQALRMALEESAPARIALVLSALHDAVGPELRILREDLAAMCGVTLGTVVRELAGLRRKKLVETGWKRLVIKNPAGLRRLAASLK